MKIDNVNTNYNIQNCKKIIKIGNANMNYNIQNCKKNYKS